MEEILASIRRIISEDSTPPAPLPVPKPRPFGGAAAVPNALAQAAVAMPVVMPAPQVRAPAPTQSHLSDDDDILDLGSAYSALTRTPMPPALRIEPVATIPVPALPFAELAIAPVAAVAANDRELPVPEPLSVPIAAAFEEIAPAATAQIAESPMLEISAPLGAELEMIADGSPPLPVETLSTGPEPSAFVLPGSFQAEPPAEAAAAGFVTVEEPANAEAVVETSPESPVEMFVQAAPAIAIEETVPVMLPAPAVAARTLEDAVADMLKPMLREWLDANMPRIIEKAMANGV